VVAYREGMIDESKIAERYRALGPELNERQRRLWAASEARSHGRGGIAAVVRATGISKNTVVRGIAEVREGARLDAGRVRRPGAGRPGLTESDPGVVAALEALVAQEKVEVQGDIVKPAGFEVTLLPEEARAKEQIAKAFGAAGLAVPAVKEVLGSLTVEPRRAEKLLRILLQERQLVRVSPELIFHSEALRHLKEQLSTYRKGKGERISVPAFKELTGISRKYAIPLLEYLDRQRLTRRAGDERVIL